MSVDNRSTFALESDTRMVLLIVIIDFNASARFAPADKANSSPVTIFRGFSIFDFPKMYFASTPLLKYTATPIALLLESQKIIKSYSVDIMLNSFLALYLHLNHLTKICQCRDVNIATFEVPLMLL
ncbi:hypothetical protein DERF_002754 [Dermatophagoides farinae]|uniref:Uncharacterized protein n=1 Tax=Dermatophagoides farinae TaxID=6954 RepID=A0A922IDH7_DERFA|nr:hypothetical protein DERF_002754 [Dermatophagoides farinae]